MMVPEEIDVEMVQQGIRRAALAHHAEIATLQAELREAYKELASSAAVAERTRVIDELNEARTELEKNRKKLRETERKLAALSQSRLGKLQLRYWQFRKGQRSS